LDVKDSSRTFDLSCSPLVYPPHVVDRPKQGPSTLVGGPALPPWQVAVGSVFSPRIRTPHPPDRRTHPPLFALPFFVSFLFLVWEKKSKFSSSLTSNMSSLFSSPLMANVFSADEDFSTSSRPPMWIPPVLPSTRPLDFKNSNWCRQGRLPVFTFFSSFLVGPKSRLPPSPPVFWMKDG